MSRSVKRNVSVGVLTNKDRPHPPPGGADHALLLHLPEQQAVAVGRPRPRAKEQEGQEAQGRMVQIQVPTSTAVPRAALVLGLGLGLTVGMLAVLIHCRGRWQ